eukprot:1753901-Alexandrium_andersonii.AAC.1
MDTQAASGWGKFCCERARREFAQQAPSMFERMAVVPLVFPHVAGILAGGALENEKYRDIRLQL